MTALSFIVAILAVWEIVEIWHHSHLLAPWRAVVECWPGWAGRVLQCPFCLCPWVSLLVVLALGLGHWLDARGQPGLSLLVKAPFYAFAAARAANAANDLVHGWCRTPRNDGLPPAPGNGAGGDGGAID